MPKIVMYATAVCPYCVRAEQLLRRKGVTEIEKVRVELEPARRDEMMARTNGRRTVPQIFIAGRGPCPLDASAARGWPGMSKDEDTAGSRRGRCAVYDAKVIADLARAQEAYE